MEARSFCSALALRGIAILRTKSAFTQCIFAGFALACLVSDSQHAVAQMMHVYGQMPVVRQQPSRQQFVAHGENFYVFASSPQFAEQVLQAAEQYRRDLAVHWLGKELPPWPQRCPVHVNAAANLGASGKTEFGPTPTGVGNWNMVVDGTPERILDSVLPHEISHTIIASHFAKYAQQYRFVPRWADEGACTTVEHESEKLKHRHFLHQFLKTGRGLAFNKMFRLKEYPEDILPLYAQGHSAVQFLIDQSNPRAFIRFLEQGMETQNWELALKTHYDYETVGKFQYNWNKWLFDGSPNELLAYSPKLQSSRATNGTSTAPATLLASQPFRNGQLDGKLQFAIGNTDPTPAQLATGVRPASMVGPESSISPDSSKHSWYKSRLREVSGGGSSGSTIASASVTPPAELKSMPMPATGGKPIRTPASVQLPQPTTSPIPSTLAEQTVVPAATYSGASVLPHGTARPQPVQTPRVQVLQWGPAGPPQANPGVSGIRATPPAARFGGSRQHPSYHY